MGLFTAERQNVAAIVMQKPDEQRNANIVALNALPLVKAAKALDTFTFGWNAAVSAGSIIEGQAERDAFAVILAAVQNAQPCTTTVPKGMDKTAVEALKNLWTNASTNAKSPLCRAAAAASIIEQGK